MTSKLVARSAALSTRLTPPLNSFLVDLLPRPLLGRRQGIRVVVVATTTAAAAAHRRIRHGLGEPGAAAVVVVLVIADRDRGLRLARERELLVEQAAVRVGVRRRVGHGLL